MSEETLRRQLYDSFAYRSHIYHLLFRELASELGEDKAAELMGKAITSAAPRTPAGKRHSPRGTSRL